MQITHLRSLILFVVTCLEYVNNSDTIRRIDFSNILVTPRFKTIKY